MGNLINNKLNCRMKDSEFRLFKDIIKDSKYYIEFGCGGSTFTLLENSETKIFSVESDLEWINKLKQYYLIDNGIKENRLFFYHSNIGEVEDWGYPKNEDMIDNFYDYSSTIFNLVEKEKVDTVFIDGRFRVACGLKTIIELNKNNNLKVIIHDFNRKEYQILLRYYTIEKLNETLFLLKIKDNINLEELNLEYQKYKNDKR